MSIKGKNLQFEAAEPAFLRLLRNQSRSGVEDPDRQINPVARPKKQISKGDDDDGPVYVVEGSDVQVSKDDIDALVNEKGGQVDGAQDSGTTKPPGELAMARSSDLAQHAEESNRAKQKVADVGILAKKRKAAKIIGNDDDDSEPLLSAPAPKSKKPKKKAKPVKLSFNDDDGT
jgi:hypothetical protein